MVKEGKHEKEIIVYYHEYSHGIMFYAEYGVCRG